MAWDIDNSQWRFTQCKKNGVEIFGVILPNFHQDFHRFIDDGTLVPGWPSGKCFLCTGTTHHVSATSLVSTILPSFIVKASSYYQP
jgi:hypothetical protein